MSKGIKPRNYGFLEKFNWYLPGVADLFILLAFLLGGALAGNVVSLLFIGLLGPEAGMEYGMLVSYPLMFIPAMLYASIRSRNNSFTRGGRLLDSRHFSPSGGVLCALFAVLATLAAAYCTDALLALLPEMPESLKALLEGMTQGTLWINFLMVSIFAPFFEEWLCRGMILRGLLGNGMKSAGAIAVSALFFAFIHLNPWQAVPAFLLGCLFGYVYYKTGSLRLTMLMHFTNNSFSLLMSNIDALKDADSWMDVLPGGRYWLIFAGCILLLALIVRAFSRIPQEHAGGNADPVPALFEE